MNKAKTIMTVLGSLLVGAGSLLVSSKPEIALILTTLGGLLGGGAHIPQPGQGK